MSQPIQFWSHKIGPNPWKNVIVFEELGIPYATEYLDFGNNLGGVEHPSFLKKNAAGRVPLIHDPATGMILTESNVINHYLLDHYDKNNILSPATEQDKYLVDKYLSFQSSTQAPFYAQSLQMRNKKNFDGVAHFQHLVKRTLRTIDDELRGKEFLVGGKCTLADLAFIPWDLMLDLVLQGDAEAGTASDRKQLFPNWYNWHIKMIQREAVQKMMKLKEEVNAN
ncbi:Glutathione S-transferase 1 [Trichoderma lentiforme]|uniref:Glutathione S-transferase 1 n=1 Tax=Trichoderma lentiforme TaxID=1567552 RepID=A0A9P4XMW3_9HYPO|nr:Glutathione S-transferase 1 [Trichoderma lentiforme]